MVLSATFSNISAISWRPVLLVEEAGVPEKNRRPWASNWLNVSLFVEGLNRLIESQPPPPLGNWGRVPEWLNELGSWV
jgi:hypothetical protein